MKTITVVSFVLLSFLLSACDHHHHHKKKIISSDLVVPTEENPKEVNWKGGLFNVWEPNGYMRGIIILHQGKNCFDDCDNLPSDQNLVPIAERFASQGYLVYGFEMPPLPHNGPIEQFYHPVKHFINDLPPYVPVIIIGFDDGGWVASSVAAFSTRLNRAYSVQGDAPHFPSESDCTLPTADYVLCNPPQPYLTLYQWAGTMLVHIYAYDNGSPLSIINFPGIPNYPYMVDPTDTQHEFTQWTVEFILNDLNNYGY